MTTLNTVAADLKNLFAKEMAGYTVSPLILTRTQKLLDMMTPFHNDAIVNLEVANQVVGMFTADPALLFKDSVIVDNVIHPMMTDEAECAQVLNGLIDYLGMTSAEEAATIAFITRVSAEPFLIAA